MKTRLLLIAMLIISNYYAITQTLSSQWYIESRNDSIDFYNLSKGTFSYYEVNPDIVNTKGSGYKPFLRWYNFWKDRVYMGDSSKTSYKYLPSAYNQYSINKNNLKTISPFSNWSILGPKILPTQNKGIVVSLFVNPSDHNIIYAGTNASGLWKTINGGTNWAIQADLLNAKFLTSVNFFNNSIGCAVGLDRTIIWTEDGGINWVLLPPHPLVEQNKQFNSVCFTDTTSFCIVGQTGTILTGYGNTYQTSPTSNWLSSVFFTSPDTGYIGGDGGFILKTIDGGTMWTSQFTNTIEGIISIFFINPDTGYAVGYNGTILKTINGGTVGIENRVQKNKEDVMIFIDPALQFIEITGDIIGNEYYYEIINSEGKTLFSNKIIKSNERVSIKNLPKDIYFFRVQNKRGCKTEKFVVI